MFGSRNVTVSAISDQPRFVFVLGTGRCGSTMVQEVMAEHPAVGFVSNLEERVPQMRSLGRWGGLLYRGLPASMGKAKARPTEGYRLLDREVSQIISQPFRDLVAEDITPWLAAHLQSFFLRRAQAAPVFMHKFTGWPRAGFLQGIFPEARFIHVIRDGRAVANSWLQIEWWRGYNGPENWQWGPLPEPYQREWEESGKSFPLLAGILWKLLIDAFDSARQEVPSEQWMEVRYEDVVASPKECFRAMLQFSGLEEDRAFGAALGRHAFGRGRTEAFRRDLDPRSLELLTRSLARHLHAHGYSSIDRGWP